jgi:hypothetical protein
MYINLEEIVDLANEIQGSLTPHEQLLLIAMVQAPLHRDLAEMVEDSRG